jgi:hypothetical protein
MKSSTQRRSPTIDRAFCIVDLENLAQGSLNVGYLSRNIHQIVLTVLQTFETHMTVVATGPLVLAEYPEVLWNWTGCRFLTGKGLDGADKELARVINSEPAAAASSHVLIWSGDGYFAEATASLRSNGCAVSVFGPIGAISDQLRCVANDVCELPLDLITQPNAATDNEYLADPNDVAAA